MPSIKDINKLLPVLSSGEQLKKDLGLSKFRYVWIQKVINNVQNIYIITYDSRFTSLFYTNEKLKKLKFANLTKSKQSGFRTKFDNFKLTPSILLHEFNGKIRSGALVFNRDLAGEHYRDKSMFENIQDNWVKKKNKVNLKEYINKLLERKDNIKAWYNPSSDWFYTFNTNLLHNEVAYSELKLDDADEAIRKGYIRIYLDSGQLAISTRDELSDKEFTSLVDRIKGVTNWNKVRTTYLTTNKNCYLFRKGSFFFADSMEAGIKTAKR